MKRDTVHVGYNYMEKVILMVHSIGKSTKVIDNR